MRALGKPALRRLAVRALAHRTDPPGGSEAIAIAARRAYDDLARVSAPLIGQVGVDSLNGRALHLAQREYSWLVPMRDPEQADGPLAQVMASLKQQDPVVAAEAAGAVFAILTGLLVTFIGEAMTAGLLQKAWPDAYFDASTEERKG
jgi:hypothetical protein